MTKGGNSYSPVRLWDLFSRVVEYAGIGSMGSRLEKATES
jgi:hypothetical protein